MPKQQVQRRASRGKRKDSGSAAQPSSHVGMGARVIEDGVSFRVWAPHADAVSVIGEFNDWADEAHPLAAEDEGHWSGDVAGAQPGQSYKYAIRNGEQKLERCDPCARQINRDGAAIIVARPGEAQDDFTCPPWNELCLYELHIGTFARPKPDQVGTFKSVMERLPYLRDLGINAIQLLPVTSYPGERSWGYDTNHIFALEPDYGTPEEFRALVRAAHAQGIAILVDVVYNHLGPADLFLWRFDGWHEEERGGIYFYQDERANTPWGDTRPDYGRAEVRQYLRDNALMWFEEYNVDGVRVDGTAYIRDVEGNNEGQLEEGWTLMRWINEELHERFPGRIRIAEDHGYNEWLTKDIGAGGAGFDAQWCRLASTWLRDLVRPIEDSDRDLELVAELINYRYNDDVFDRINYVESHDEVAKKRKRLPEEIAPGDADGWFATKRSSLIGLLLFTAPGIPMIFQGQELLEHESWDADRPMDWSRVKQFDHMLRMYRDLIHLRRNMTGCTRGLTGQNAELYHRDDEAKVVAYQRWEEGGPHDSVVVVCNFRDAVCESHRIGLPRGGRWLLRFNSDAEVYYDKPPSFQITEIDAEEQEADGLPWSAIVNLGPYSGLILSQDE